MDSMEILRAILEADKRAAAVYDAAIAAQSGKEGRIAEGMDALRAQYRDSTAAAVRQLKDGEAARAGAREAELQKECQGKLAALDAAFEAHRGEYEESVLRAVMGTGNE